MPESQKWTADGSKTNSNVTVEQTGVAHNQDPVSFSTGELFSDNAPDFTLGGPLPLTLRR